MKFSVNEHRRDPELAIGLREQHPEVTPAYHFNKVI
jgi:predicted DNA-binding protein (MmcQ/YjbR family)